MVLLHSVDQRIRDLLYLINQLFDNIDLNYLKDGKNNILYQKTSVPIFNLSKILGFESKNESKDKKTILTSQSHFCAERRNGFANESFLKRGSGKNLFFKKVFPRKTLFRKAFLFPAYTSTRFSSGRPSR